jgi:hypothetical protein
MRPPSPPATGGDPDSEVRDGIINADSEAAGAIEWPDWNTPPEPGR